MFSRLLAFLLFIGTAVAQTPSKEPVAIWPEGKMPGEGAKAQDQQVKGPGEQLGADQQHRRDPPDPVNTHR